MWRDVKGYEGIYVINEAGDVKRVDTEKILSPAVSTAGYLVVSLWKENKGTLKTIHRLLAECFIYNDDPLQKRTVNHIDGNKTNNRLENLEWVSYSQNNKHAYDTGLKIVTEAVRNNGRNHALNNAGNSYRSIPIVQIDEFGNELREFSSIKQAAAELGCNRSGIYRVLKGRVNTIKNMRFKYKEER